MTTMVQEISNFDHYIKFLEEKKAAASALGMNNLRIALGILYEDQLKWKQEYENGTVNYDTAINEIMCLYQFAKEQIRLGESDCDPGQVKKLLTR